MNARFIGENGSMGLITGKLYEITAIKGHRWPIWIRIENALLIDSLRCPYASFESFFKNWEIVKNEIER